MYCYKIHNDCKDDIRYATVFPSIKLGEIEIDLLVKYTRPMNFLSWVEKYLSEELELNIEIERIIYKFNNFCKNITNIDFKRKLNGLYCFLILLNNIKLSCYEIDNVIEIFFHLINNSYDQYFDILSFYIDMCPDIEENFCYSKPYSILKSISYFADNFLLKSIEIENDGINSFIDNLESLLKN